MNKSLQYIRNIDDSNIEALDTLIDKLEIYAFTVMLDNMENEDITYAIKDNKYILKRLIERGIKDERILLYNTIHQLLDSGYTCPNCKSNKFNFECPVLVCEECKNEYIIASKNSKKVCESCISHDLKTCPQEQLLLTELKINKQLKESKNECDYVIIEGGITTVQKSRGNIEQYNNQSIKSN